MNIQEAAARCAAGGTLTRAEALEVLALPDEALPELLNAVFIIRKKFKGLSVGIQLLTNARSGNCSQNCAYCAQARDSTASIEKYNFIPYETAAAHGALAFEKNLARHCIGLSGIRFSDAEIESLCEYIRALKKQSPVSICCSIGFLTRHQAVMLKEAGLDRVNHNLNTSRSYYPTICTTHTYDERIANIKMLQDTGFEICCGGIAGMGESAEDLVDMFFDIQSIAPNSVPVNFLIPLKGTGKENAAAPLLPEYCLKVLCLARLLLPRQDIRCAAGRELYLKGREADLLKAADSLFASGYLTAGGQSIDDTIAAVTAAGFEFRIER
ncbi:MAG: biotin synthase BioB [Spirochaetaceae bacterium]|jgi:biotin synthase|nr:biotin synthase BioB [Spirochaetaceae bacterium]